MERALLLAARHKKHWSLEEAAERIGVDKATLQRWEKGKSVPQALNLRNLCEVFETTAWELGLEEEHPGVTQNAPSPDSEDDALVFFRQHDLTLRLMRQIWNWPRQNARYQMLQATLMLELEDNTMNDDMSRRDALRFLALVPLEMFGLSQAGAVLKGSPEDILKHCAAGITACWYLRKGKELAFANQAISHYIPTLKALTQTAPMSQRKAAAELLAQCYLLKAVLSWNITTPRDGIGYAQQAEVYGTLAESRLLRVTALRATAAALCYANQWGQALQTAETARYLLEQKEKPTPSQPAEEPISQLVSSYVYAGLATYRAYEGRKEDALQALRQARKTFFERDVAEPAPLWVDHNIGNLFLNDGLTHMHLELYKGAVDAFGRIEKQYAEDATVSFACSIEAYIEQVTVEVSRDDQSRDVEKCIVLWTQGIEGAKAMRSNKHWDNAITAYASMRAAWPAEQRIKDLREYTVHW